MPTSYVIDADGQVAVRMLNKQTATIFIEVVTEVQGGGRGDSGG